MHSPCHHHRPHHHPESEWHWSYSWLCRPTCCLPCHSPGSPGRQTAQDYQTLELILKKTTKMYIAGIHARTDRITECKLKGTFQEIIINTVVMIAFLQSVNSWNESCHTTLLSQEWAWNWQITVSNPSLVTDSQRHNLPCPQPQHQPHRSDLLHPYLFH